MWPGNISGQREHEGGEGAGCGDTLEKKAPGKGSTKVLEQKHAYELEK